MLQLITSYCADIDHYARGGPDTGALIHDHRAAYEEFKLKIRNTAPNFQPFLNESDSKKTGKRKVNPLEDDDAAGDNTAIGNHKFYLEDMRKHLENSITRELPNNVPFEAKVTLMQLFQQPWAGFMMACFERVVNSTFALLMERLKVQFSRYPALQLHLRCVDRRFKA